MLPHHHPPLLFFPPHLFAYVRSPICLRACHPSLSRFHSPRLSFTLCIPLAPCLHDFDGRHFVVSILTSAAYMFRQSRAYALWEIRGEPFREALYRARRSVAEQHKYLGSKAALRSILIDARTPPPLSPCHAPTGHTIRMRSKWRNMRIATEDMQ